MVTTEYLIAFLLMTGCYAFMLWMLTQRLKEAGALALMLRDMISVAQTRVVIDVTPSMRNEKVPDGNGPDACAGNRMPN